MNTPTSTISGPPRARSVLKGWPACGLSLLGGLALIGAAVAAPVSPPQITAFKLEPGRKLTLTWSGTTNPVVVEAAAQLAAPDWQPVPGTDWPIAGTNWSGILPAARANGFIRLVAHPPGGPPRPSKTISLSLIGIHTVGTDSYNGDCISCHGDRLTEKALDGVTPAAHSTMLLMFGTGNERCVFCHLSGQQPGGSAGPDFLTGSAGHLRKQVDIIQSDCTVCHRKGSGLEFYDNRFIP